MHQRRTDLSFKHITSGISAQAKVSVILNQLAVWVESQSEWDIFDLRNIVRNIVLNQLVIIGYLKGYTYDLEVTRVLNQNRGIDWVFGIDIPCIAEQRQPIDLDSILPKLIEKTMGQNGVVIESMADKFLRLQVAALQPASFAASVRL